MSKRQVTGLCEGNSPVTSEFPAQRFTNAENDSIWWRHHEYYKIWCRWVIFQVNNTNEVGKLDQDITRTKTDLYNVMKQGMSECFRWNALILILMNLFENNVSKIDGGLQMV